MSGKLLRELSNELQVADKYGSTELHKAARRGDLGTMIQAAAAGCDISRKNQKGLMPLHEACLEGHTRMVQLLLALGSDVNARTGEMWTPLICAAGNGHRETTRILVASGADPDLATSSGHSAAHMAAWKGLTDILVILSRNGHNLSRKTDRGQTPLDLATESGQEDCISYIKAAVANKEIEDCLCCEYSPELQSQQKESINKCHCLHIRMQELQLGMQALCQQRHSSLVRSASLPIQLAQSPLVSSQHKCHSSSPFSSPPPIRSRLSFPSSSSSSSNEVHNVISHISPSPPTSPRQKPLCVTRAGVPISPLAIKRHFPFQATSAIGDHHCRSKSVPQDLNLSSLNHLQENKVLAVSRHRSVENVSNEEVQDSGDNTMSVPVIQRKGISSERWANVIHRRRKTWSNKTTRDEQTVEVSMTELHRQSLHNPNSMANVTKVS